MRFPSFSSAPDIPADGSPVPFAILSLVRHQPLFLMVFVGGLPRLVRNLNLAREVLTTGGMSEASLTTL